jgi:tetratricopeptide (TPR) repeat protein
MAHFWVAFETPSVEEAKQAMARALEYSGRASKKERWYIEAVNTSWSGQTQEYIRLLERIVERYPEEKLALLWLGDAYASVFQLDKAINCFKRAAEIDPLYKKAYNKLAYKYQEIGDYEQALWAINKYIELAPDEHNPYDSRGEIYAINGQLDKAIESYEKALEIKSDYYTSARSLGDIYVLRGDYEKAESYYRMRVSHVNAIQRGWGRLDLVRILLHQGKFREALRRLDVGIETDRIELGDCWPIVYKIQRKVLIDFWFLEDYSAALEEAELVKNAVDVIDPDNIHWASVYKTATGMTHARMGNLTKADSLIACLKQETDTTEVGDLVWSYLWMLAHVEHEKGNYDSAITIFEQVYQRDWSSGIMRILGHSYLRANRVGDAVDMLERCLRRYDAGNLLWPEYYVITHYWLGQAYEASGWNDKALEQYETFLDIWKNADEGLPSVEDARTRLARLKGES